MNHLLNVLDGIASAFAWGPAQAPSRGSYRVIRGGFHRDQQKLRADVENVGRDMKKTLREYGESITEGGSKERQG